MLYIEYDEPVHVGEEFICSQAVRMLASDAIRLRRAVSVRVKGRDIYESDQDALDDFMVINWARLVEAP
jgi:hypothetical protein